MLLSIVQAAIPYTKVAEPDLNMIHTLIRKSIIRYVFGRVESEKAAAKREENRSGSHAAFEARISI